MRPSRHLVAVLVAVLLAASLVAGCARPSPRVHRPRMDQPVSTMPPVAREGEAAPPLRHDEQVRVLLAEVREPLRIRLFVHTPEGDELSAELEAAARGLIAAAPASGRLDVQDPLGSEVLAEEARLLGVRPLGSPPRRRPLDELPSDGSYRAMVVAIGSRYLVVPEVSADRGGVEFQVAEAVSRFLHGPRLVGLVTTQARSGSLVKLRRVLDRLDVRSVDPASPLSTELSALLVVGPGEPLAPAAVEKIRSFLERGGSVAFLVDGMEVTPEKNRYVVRPARTGVEKLLAGYGVRVGRDLVFDRIATRVSVPARVGRMLLSYPPIPLAPVQADQEVTPDARTVRLPFPSSLTFESPEGAASTLLLSSSRDSWTVRTGFNLDPHQRWPEAAGDGPHLLAVAMELASGSRLAVVANSRFVEDRYLDFDDNALFVRQLIEWLGGHRALSAMMFESESR